MFRTPMQGVTIFLWILFCWFCGLCLVDFVDFENPYPVLHPHHLCADNIWPRRFVVAHL